MARVVKESKALCHKIRPKPEIYLFKIELTFSKFRNLYAFVIDAALVTVQNLW